MEGRMKLKYIIRALGTLTDLGHGVAIDIPFGKVMAQLYVKQGWARLQAEFLGTGFEFMKVTYDGVGSKETLMSLELKLLGNIFRLSNKDDFVSFMNIITYVRDLVAEYEEIDSHPEL
jgi:hypothetical protein